MSAARERIGLIAGNGRFPFLVLEAARAQGLDVVVAAIKEEAFPDIEWHGAAAIHWLSLGELSKLIETFKREGVHRAIMAGQFLPFFLPMFIGLPPELQVRPPLG